ncbi:MAG: acyloxyacyl hydrolase [Candidatus Hydrogenedentes bacterium]|nr:acyloxyacyl hydrolase [Candidatus Hydrogenedentota bacterium]
MKRPAAYASLVVALAVVSVFGVLPAAQADESVSSGLFGGFDEGRWRIEVGGASGFDSGKRDRNGDSVITGNVEYEWPVFARCTLGLRAYPLFIYNQDDGDPTVWGGGVGVVGRIYQHKEERTGFFVEGGVAILGHANEIEDNSSNINFLPQAGVGYQWKSGWHTTIQIQHISNGSLASENAGANSIGVAVGFTF